MPVSDAVIRNGTIRPDGRLVHDMYLVEVRRPGESSNPWDLEKVQEAVAGNDVFRPLAESAGTMSELGLSAGELQAIGWDNALAVLPRLRSN